MAQDADDEGDGGLGIVLGIAGAAVLGYVAYQRCLLASFGIAPASCGSASSQQNCLPVSSPCSAQGPPCCSGTVCFTNPDLHGASCVPDLRGRRITVQQVQCGSKDCYNTIDVTPQGFAPVLQGRFTRSADGCLPLTWTGIALRVQAVYTDGTEEEVFAGAINCCAQNCTVDPIDFAGPLRKPIRAVKWNAVLFQNPLPCVLAQNAFFGLFACGAALAATPLAGIGAPLAVVACGGGAIGTALDVADASGFITCPLGGTMDLVFTDTPGP